MCTDRSCFGRGLRAADWRRVAALVLFAMVGLATGGCAVLAGGAAGAVTGYAAGKAAQ